MKDLVVTSQKTVSKVIWLLLAVVVGLVIVGFALVGTAFGFIQLGVTVLSLCWYVPVQFVAICHAAAKAPFPFPYVWWLAAAVLSVVLIDACILDWLQLSKDSSDGLLEGNISEGRSRRRLIPIAEPTRRRLKLIAGFIAVAYFCWYATVQPALHRIDSWVSDVERHSLHSDDSD